MAMDEEIIQRIIYIIIAIILFVVFSSKKKSPQKQTSNNEKKTVIETKEADKNIFQPVETIKEHKKISNETNKEQLEVIVEDEIFEDETKIDRNIIYKKSPKTSEEALKEENFTFTKEELRKAVILSEIIHPKHF